MSIKVQKLFWVIKMSTCCQMWRGKRWETSLWTCASLSKAIVAIVSQNVSWVIVCSLPQGQQNKWVPRSSMVWPHWHHERWTIVGCGKPRWVQNVVRKWVIDKRNVGVVGRTNNQVLALGPTHEQRHAHAISKGSSTEREANSYSCKPSTKKTYNWG
jgi:hypothetical protein